MKVLKVSLIDSIQYMYLLQLYVLLPDPDIIRIFKILYICILLAA